MRNRNVSMFLMSCIFLSLVLIISGCGSDDDPAPTPNFGVAVLNGGWLGILDGTTNELTTPLLTGELGSSGGGLLDVAISPDGKTTLVSNFGDSTVYFIDTSVPSEPVVSGSVTLSFFVEDIDITPDGRYALATDGGSSSYIAVLDVENISLVEETVTADPALYHQAVAVAADGETVLTIDYNGGLLNAFTLDSDGHLTYVASTDVSNGSTLYPVNVAISPDGKTAIVANTTFQIASNMAFTVLTISDPGQVSITDQVTSGLDIVAAQSIVFNRAGTKAYAYCQQEYVAPDPEPDPVVYPNNVIIELNVTETGKASDSGTYVEVDFQAQGQLFGVDTLAIDYRDNYLYVSNMSIGETNHVQVVDLTDFSVIDTVDFDPVAIGDPAVDTDSIPVGITIWNP